MSNVFDLVPGYARFDSVFSMVGSSGYAIGLGIVNVTPEVSYTTYQREWIKQYCDKRYAWLDPVIQFTAFGEGTKRWSELTSIKLPILSNIVMKRAKIHGLNYGLIIVRRDASEHRKKHMLSIARADRELTDREVETTLAMFDELIAGMQNIASPSDRQLEILTLFAQGMTRSSVAAKVNLSEETVKKDIEAVRRLWGAKNTTEAVGMAIARKLIDPYDKQDW